MSRKSRYVRGQLSHSSIQRMMSRADRGKEWNSRCLVAAYIVLQQLGVVVRHFLEVRNHPVLIYRVAMESARELVVNSAARHVSSVVTQMFPTSGSPVRA